jgi:hypothetical protein
VSLITFHTCCWSFAYSDIDLLDYTVILIIMKYYDVVINGM